MHGVSSSSSAEAARDRSGLRAVSEAREVGLQTVGKLDAQGETIRHAQTAVDSNQHLIDKSGRVVRGMTWWGWVQNAFSSPPAPPEPQPRATRRTPPAVSREAPAGLVRHASVVAAPREAASSSRPRDARLREQQEYLGELSQGLEELLEVGGAIGERVEEQAEAVPKLHASVEHLWQSTRHVTRQAGRVMESYATRATPKLLCHVALREVESRRYVRARGDVVALSDEVDVLRATCRFALYEKRAHLLGLQSTVSKLYVGITFSGAIKCAATRFGRWEEFDIDLTRPNATPILCVAANFGAGCWIRVEAREGRLLPAEPRTCAQAVNRAAKFEIVVLDDVYAPPAYAEEILSRRGSATTQMEGESLDAKKRAKREANRRSAQLSRARKKAYVEDLKAKNNEYARCEVILACHPDMVVAFDAAGTIEFANPRACLELGYASDELEGLCFFDMLDDGARLRFQSSLQRVMSRPNCRVPLHIETPVELTTKSGRSLGVDVTAQCTRTDDPGHWTVVCSARPRTASESLNVFALAATAVADDHPKEKKPCLRDLRPPLCNIKTPTIPDRPLDQDPPSGPLNVFALALAAANLEPVDTSATTTTSNKTTTTQKTPPIASSWSVGF
ncbi:hypothetical protein CTAYLR_008792 [Chrysophaeum taylorii]|uniref:t-SNARE coiled-coil homology domain-containing protein n=1 Tax=Chrysophaeum taylorii TaxID=2483200 RepID=A0AAD7UNX0_9STRA|nr:hypothetical protein CTAYLR_008792 [Chrysophaeum taylorii]